MQHTSTPRHRYRLNGDVEREKGGLPKRYFKEYKVSRSNVDGNDFLYFCLFSNGAFFPFQKAHNISIPLCYKRNACELQSSWLSGQLGYVTVEQFHYTYLTYLPIYLQARNSIWFVCWPLVGHAGWLSNYAT